MDVASFRRVETTIENLGFTRAGKGQYRLNGMRLSLAGGCPTLETDIGVRDPGLTAPADASGASTTSPDVVDPLRGQLGRPGLWKRVEIAEDSGDVRCRFELPPAILDRSDGDEEEGAEPFAAAMAWAIETARGEVPADWTQPSAEDIGMEKDEFVVQHGRFVRQGRLVRGEGLLALRVPILKRSADVEDRPVFDPQASDPRSAWLRRLLVDGQNRWRMVRVGLDSPEALVLAEIDLSGAPHSVAGILVRASLGVLRGIVTWLVAPVDLLADRALAREALQVCAVRD